MPDSFKIALVGAGGIAAAHRAAAEALGTVEIVAIVDSSPHAREASQIPAFADVAALLADGDKPDAAIVCTPPGARQALIEPLLQAGLPVLCEKPLARTLAEATPLVTLAQQHARVPTAVAYCHRFTPAVVEMRRRLAAGVLGTPVRFENTFACWHPTMKERWMSDRPVSGGGSFIDTGCHSLDLLRFLLGDATVKAASFQSVWPGRGESNATVLLETDSGVAATIASGWQEADRFTVTLVGTDATLHYDYLDPLALHLTPSHDGRAETIEIETHEVRFARQLAAFAAAVRGEEVADLCSFAEAAEVARLVDQAYAAGDATPKVI